MDARVLIDLARDKGFKAWSPRAARRRRILPSNSSRRRSHSTCSCPDMLGWTVLSQLKHNSLTTAHSRPDHHR